MHNDKFIFLIFIEPNLHLIYVNCTEYLVTCKTIFMHRENVELIKHLMFTECTCIYSHSLRILQTLLDLIYCS